MARRLDIARQTSFRVFHDIHSSNFAVYLASRLAIKHSLAEDFLAQGLVMVNNWPASLDYSPRKGDIVNVNYPRNFTSHLKATPMAVEVLYEDEWLVAVNKDSGVVVHPARGHMDGNTLMNGLAHRYATPDGEAPYLAPSHRLDRDTSGVVLFARKPEAHIHLAKQFQDRTVRKAYLAKAWGKADFSAITADAPLGKLEEGEFYGVVALEAGGKEAATELRVLRQERECFLVEARPLTGRTHQIRVHLAHLGFPIMGDRLYSHGKPHAQRMMLHAWKLEATHPATGERLSFTAPPPPGLDPEAASAEQDA